MGLTLRLTFEDNDYNYQIINSKDIDQGATEFSLKLNGETVELIKDKKNVWIEKDGNSLDPELVQALGSWAFSFLAFKAVILIKWLFNTLKCSNYVRMKC